MERFVQRIVGGGLALVAGLWIAAVADPSSPPWIAGLGVAVVGVAGLAAGIWSQVEAAPT